jgi:site-specific DNA-methyltransferase (adenine-specific)
MSRKYRLTKEKRTPMRKQGCVLSKLLVSQGGKQDTRTPQDIFKELDKEFHFDLDPCTSDSKPNNLHTPYYFTKEQDGLKQDWSKYRSIFINPPFNQLPHGGWIPKILSELDKNKEQTIVLFVPVKTETKWFHTLINSEHLKELRFQYGRVTFEGFEDSFIVGMCYFILKHKAKLSQHQEDVLEFEKLLDNWIKSNKTSWKYLKSHGFETAEDYGDCIFLDLKITNSLSPIEELKTSLRGEKNE